MYDVRERVYVTLLILSCCMLEACNTHPPLASREQNGVDMGRERGERLESMKGEGEKGRGRAGEGAGKRKEGTEGGVGKGWGITHTHLFNGHFLVLPR